MKHQEIVFNLAGQRFFYDSPEGRPSASPTPTVTVYLASNDDDGVTEAATTGACSIDAVDTTLASAAGSGEVVLQVVSAAAIARGRRYFLTDTDGDREAVEVMSISGTTIGLRRPLMNDFAAGSTFQGTRITIAVSATWMVDRSKITDAFGSNWRTDVQDDPAIYAGHPGYRLRWLYTVDGVAILGFNFADLVRYQSKNLITPLDVDGRFAGWIDRLPPDYQRDQGAALIEDAFHAVRMDLLGDAVTLRKVRTTDIIGELTAYKANLLAAQHSILAGRSDTAALKVAEELYTQRYNQLAREPKFPLDSTGGGGAAQAERTPAWRR